MSTNIRKAKIEDSKFIFQLICDLAEYEKAPDQVKTSVTQIEKDGFGPEKLFEAIILEYKNKSVGMALFYNRYSTWKGKSLYLEDLYVQPEYRGHGLGLEAMKYLAQYAVETNCQRFEWQVLDWNEPSIKFYESLGSDLDGEWINCRLEGDKIKALAIS
jgi:RimJ/RimL family protein N-acetyltransferase